jgi:hypothetical protein
MRGSFGCVGWSVGGSRRGEASGKLPRHPRGFPGRLPIVGIWSVDRAAHLGQEFRVGSEAGRRVFGPQIGGFRRLGEVDKRLPGRVLRQLSTGRQGQGCGQGELPHIPAASLDGVPVRC